MSWRPTIAPWPRGSTSDRHPPFFAGPRDAPRTSTSRISFQPARHPRKENILKLKKKRNPSSPPPVAEPATLLRLLKESKRPLSPEDLLPVLGLHRRKRGMVDEMLHDLEAQGKLIRLGRAYSLSDRVRLVAGRVQFQRSGAAFLIPEEPGQPDIFLGQDTGGAWHGDRVRAAVTRSAGRGKNAEGRVVEIVERGRDVLAVRIMRPAGRDVGDNAWLCRPTDPHLDFALLARNVDPALGLQKGDIALAKPGEQVDSALWEGVITSRLGPETLAQVQELLTKANHGVPTKFPADALAEAQKLPPVPSESDFKGREDLRATPFVTIDGATARDFDDAVFVARKGKGYELWVAIADVAHYVPMDSALDREAYERGNSYYFPSSVEPMFPQALSNGLCSLNPLVPRLSMAVRMQISSDGTRGEARVMNAVIKSHARLTYSRARDVCVDKLPEARETLAKESGADVVDMLDIAEELARKMRVLRIKRGSLDFDLPEGEVVFDPAGQPVSVRPKVRHFAHQLIEEFMIAANEAVSEYLAAHALPCLYRVHAEPDHEKLENLYTLLARLDGERAVKRKNPTRFTDDDFTPEALGRLLASVAGTEREFLVHRLVLRSMKQARYQPENEGHYGLASESYAHFTSPIRRYADLVVHRLIKIALGDRDLPVPGFKRLAEIGQHLSARERVAMSSRRAHHHLHGLPGPAAHGGDAAGQPAYVLRNRTKEPFKDSHGVREPGAFGDVLEVHSKSHGAGQCCPSGIGGRDSRQDTFFTSYPHILVQPNIANPYPTGLALDLLLPIWLQTCSSLLPFTVERLGLGQRDRVVTSTQIGRTTCP